MTWLGQTASTNRSMQDYNRGRADAAHVEPDARHYGRIRDVRIRDHQAIDDLNMHV